MKWGVRRFQNEDGSLTAAGEKRYSKLDKKIEKNDRAAEKILSAREKNREKIAGKYDKKLEKLEADKASFDPIKEGVLDEKGRMILSKEDVQASVDGIQKVIDNITAKKDATLKDFDLGTQFVKEGYEKYSQVIRDYKDAKLKTIEDKAYKNSTEYKRAVNRYANQVISNIWYGTSSATVFDYAHNIARDYYKKNSD